MDAKTSQIQIAQYQDTQTLRRTLHRIAIYEPKKIVIPETMVESPLHILLLNNVGRDCEIVAYERRSWNDEKGITKARHTAK